MQITLTFPIVQQIFKLSLCPANIFTDRFRIQAHLKLPLQINKAVSFKQEISVKTKIIIPKFNSEYNSDSFSFMRFKVQVKILKILDNVIHPAIFKQINVAQ